MLFLRWMYGIHRNSTMQRLTAMNAIRTGRTMPLTRSLEAFTSLMSSEYIRLYPGFSTPNTRYTILNII